MKLKILLCCGSMLALLGALAGPPAVAAGPGEEARTTAWLGVWLADAVDGGVEVVAVAPGGPAQRAGLLRGDIVVEAAGETVRREDALGRLLLRRHPGDTLEMTVLRGGKSIRARVELGHRPPAVPAVPRVPAPPPPRWEALSAYERARKAEQAPFGLQSVVVTPALRAHFGAPEMTGVLVTRVEPGELAEQVGIRVGDLLLSIDETEINDPSSLRDLLGAWNRLQPLRAEIVRGGESRVLRIAAPDTVQTSHGATESSKIVEQARVEQQAREREVLERRLLLEIERLERRIEELKRNVERLRAEP